MLGISKQKDRYQKIWHDNAVLFGSSIMEDDTEPIYNIGVSLPSELHSELQEISKSLQQHTGIIGDWLSPHRLHITIDIPGRIGKHFLQEDLPTIKKWVIEIAATTKPFTIQLGNINCFPHVLFREVYDESGALYEMHHKLSITIPWSEQPQYRGEKFVPHMSLVYLKEKTNPLAIDDSLRNLPLCPMNVSQIYFQISADGMKDNPIAIVELGTGKLLHSQ